MGIYYHPPNPNLGAQQPLAPEVLVPPQSGPAPQNPPVIGAKMPDPVAIWWIPPPPQPMALQVVKNLVPPVSGPVAQNPPFAGGALVPLAVQIAWIPPPPQPPVGWTAIQVYGLHFLFRFDPRFRTSLQRRFVVTYSPARITSTIRRSQSAMPQGNDFSPIDPTETVTLTWDFAPLLAAGVTLLANPVPVTSCALRSGVDPSPSTRLVGGPSVVASPSTGAASQAVQQQVSTMQAGARYFLACLAKTSDSQTINLWAHALCQGET